MELAIVAAMFLAAVPDAWIIGYGVFSTVYSTIVTVAVVKLGVAQRKAEGMEMRVQTLADKRVDDKIDDLVGAMDELKERLKATEGKLGSLGDADHKLDMAVLKGLAEIKQHVVERAVSKEDLKAHQANADARNEKLADHLNRQDRDLAVIKQQLAGIPGRKGA